MAWQAGQAVDQAVAQTTAPTVIAAAGDRDRMLQEREAGRLSLGGQAARPGTMAWRAPMAKPITSIAALQLASSAAWIPASRRRASRRPSENHGSPGDPVAARQRLSPPARQVTVRHLLTHTAGVLL